MKADAHLLYTPLALKKFKINLVTKDESLYLKVLKYMA